MANKTQERVFESKNNLTKYAANGNLIKYIIINLKRMKNKTDLDTLQ